MIISALRAKHKLFPCNDIAPVTTGRGADNRSNNPSIGLHTLVYKQDGVAPLVEKPTPVNSTTDADTHTIKYSQPDFWL